MNNTLTKLRSKIPLLCIPLILLAFFISASATAQQTMIQVSGKVVGAKGKEALNGVNLLDGNNKSLGVTTAGGTFRIRVPSGTVVTFSLLGYAPQKNQFTASADGVTISLIEQANELDEVVVTALGIKREQKSLGYSATVVQGEQLTNAISNNWMDALSGKVAGVNLIRSNAGPMGSTKIILRGETNLTNSEDNQALIVVDGIVINTGSGRRSSNASDATYGTGSDNMPADYGSGMDDINPDDIASVTVLKGPGAAALYGQRGANGAIIITTKSGSQNKKGIGVTVNSNTSFESVNRWPDLQYEYGQGLDGQIYYSYGAGPDGASTSGTSSAYGPRFNGQSFYQWDPVTQAQSKERVPWVPHEEDGVKSFFDVGKTYTNAVSIDGGWDRTSARFSFTNAQNTWIVPNTGYDRNSIAMSVNSKVSDKLQISSKVNYNNRWSDNLPGAGYGNQSIMYWFIFWQPNQSINDLRNYWVNGQENRKIMYPFSTYPENPYAVSYEFLNSNNRNAFTGNVQATYDFSKEWSIQLRTSLDFAAENRAQQRPYDSGTKLPEGSYRTQEIFSREASADFLLRYNKKINPDWEASGSLGGSTLRNDYRMTSLAADGLTFPGTYNITNSKYGVATTQNISRFVLNSFYGLFTAAYKDYLFLDATGRIDWASPLASVSNPDKKVYFFYPSVNLSFVASDFFKLPAYVSYAKLRASVAGVGSGGTVPYQTDYTYINPNPLYPGALANPTQLTNPYLQPLRTRSYELGAEMKFLQDRLGLDLTVYRGSTYDQHLQRKVDPASGYPRVITNLGQVDNSGIEIALNTTPVKTSEGFSWEANFTFTANRNKIIELGDSSLVLATGPVGSSQLVATVGGSMGDLYGLGYQRAPDGQVIYDASTGYALLTSDVKYLGNTIPKGKASMSNAFSYKNFRLNILFDAQWGAVAHSLTHHKLAEQGKTMNTVPGRYNGIVGNGVIENPDGSFRPNDVTATDIDDYYRSHYGQDNAEGNTYSTDFLKFREARLDYSLSKKVTSRLGIQKATIGVFGRDLFIWSPWPGFDPEFGTLSGSDIVKGFEIGQFPSTRTFGLNLTVGF